MGAKELSTARPIGPNVAPNRRITITHEQYLEAFFGQIEDSGCPSDWNDRSHQKSPTHAVNQQESAHSLHTSPVVTHGKSEASLVAIVPRDRAGSIDSLERHRQSTGGRRKRAAKQEKNQSWRKTQSLEISNLSGLRSITGNADTESWGQSIREKKEQKKRQSRQSRLSLASGADEVKNMYSSGKASVQEMEAAFLHCVVGGAKRRESKMSNSAILGPVQEPEEPSPPSSPMPLQIMPSQPGVPQPGYTSPQQLQVEPKASATATDQESGTGGSPAAENLVKLSNRAQTAILSAMSPGDCVMHAMSEDRGCVISFRIPNLFLGFVLLLAIVDVALDVRFHFLFDRVIWDDWAVAANAILTCCAVLSFIFLRKALLSTELELTMDKLYTFVDDTKVEWDKGSRLEQWRSLAFWCLWVAVFLAAQVGREWIFAEALDQNLADESRTARYILRGITTLSWSISSFLVVLQAYVQNHLLLGLDRSLDCWCAYLLDCPDFSLGVDSWNCLQALLKCISRKVAMSFLVTQISGGLACIYCLVSAVLMAFLSGFAPKVVLVEGAFLLPVLLLFLLQMRVFWRATAITEKCRIIPAFVNQIPVGARINMERSYLVQFITDSSAGFFLREVKLTREMLLKNFMIIGGILSGLVAIMSRV